jgi:hypothetical protein
MLHRQRRWRRRLNLQRRSRQNLRRRAAWEQEPRSCCRRHPTPVQRQKRLMQVWSSSIDTPEIYIGKTKRPSMFLGFHPDVAADFRVFHLNFISLSPIMYSL